MNPLALVVAQVLARLWCRVSRSSSKTPPCFISGSSKPTQPTCTTAASSFSTTTRLLRRPSSSPAKTTPCATKSSWKSVLTTGGGGAWLWRAGGGRSRSMRPTCGATQKTTTLRWRNSWARCLFLSEGRNEIETAGWVTIVWLNFKTCFMIAKRKRHFYLAALLLLIV